MVGQMVKRVLVSSDGIRVESTDRRRDAGDQFFFDVEADPERLRALWGETGPYDYVVNCIGVRADLIRADPARRVRRALFANAVFPHLLSDIAKETDARVIHVSTDGVFAPNAGACREDTPVSATDPYGQTKALGEVNSPVVLNLRCSIVGPDPIGGRGILEWIRNRPRGAEVAGYIDHLWNGVTTLQFAHLCEKLIAGELFDRVRNEGETHHFCPNETVSKYELVNLLRERFRPDLSVIPSKGPVGPSNRVLATRYHGLPRITGSELPIRTAVAELAALN
jgi:dTDP-4-dehydrorhamnose reductase